MHHSAVRIDNNGIVYVDPFEIQDSFHDADIICVTHEHYDHCDPQSIAKCSCEKTHLVLPTSMRDFSIDFDADHIHYLSPGDSCMINGIQIKAIPAYNMEKQFHEPNKAWVGYVISVGGTVYYIAGDTDIIPELQDICCDVALLPVGGTYTMNADEAATLANRLSPILAVPTHYGSVVGTNNDGSVFLGALADGIFGELLLENL